MIKTVLAACALSAGLASSASAVEQFVDRNTAAVIVEPVQGVGGAYDVVVDSNLLPGVPKIGGVISGSFWLSGRIIAQYQR